MPTLDEFLDEGDTDALDAFLDESFRGGAAGGPGPDRLGAGLGPDRRGGPGGRREPSPSAAPFPVPGFQELGQGAAGLIEANIAFDQAGFPIDLTRPIVRGKGGEFHTELGISVNDKRLNAGRPTVIPSIVGGRIVNMREAIEDAVRIMRALGREARRIVQAVALDNERPAFDEGNLGQVRAALEKLARVMHMA